MKINTIKTYDYFKIIKSYDKDINNLIYTVNLKPLEEKINQLFENDSEIQKYEINGERVNLDDLVEKLNELNLINIMKSITSDDTYKKINNQPQIKLKNISKKFKSNLYDISKKISTQSTKLIELRDKNHDKIMKYGFILTGISTITTTIYAYDFGSEYSTMFANFLNDTSYLFAPISGLSQLIGSIGTPIIIGGLNFGLGLDIIEKFEKYNKEKYNNKFIKKNIDLDLTKKFFDSVNEYKDINSNFYKYLEKEKKI